MIRWPVDETGKNSVKPSTIPKIIALMMKKISKLVHPLDLFILFIYRVFII